ncbi:MAG: hypothetical protein FWH29_00825 [Methanobrevibacter sp.]|nr:hypothetical protein [Methanobrevibacter sp.]
MTSKVLLNSKIVFYQCTDSIATNHTGFFYFLIKYYNILPFMISSSRY